MAVTIDDVLIKIGDFRQYQWILLSVFGYAIIPLAAFPTMIVSFITAEPDWKCVDGYMNNTVCRFNKSITLTSDDYKARCKMPREAWTYVDDFTSTVTEYDLVCDKSILLSIAQSCFWVGMLFALLLGGYLADKYGRKIIWYSGCFTIVLATWVMVFPKGFVVFIVCRVFIGLGSGFRNSTSFALLTEYTTEKYRTWMGVGYFVFWAVGISILPLIGYFFSAWRTLLLVTAITAIPCIFMWWAISESPRWLLLNNKEEEAKTVLAKVARMNKTSLPDDLVLQKPVIQETKATFRQLFSGWQTAKTTLISWDLWAACALVYYGVSYGAVDLGGNRYLNVFLISVVEIPSNFFYIWFADRFGRKKSVIIGMIIAFVASAISVSIPINKSSANHGGRITAAIIAKFFINFSFSGIYVWTNELFPTVVRTTALATSSAAARIGSFASSYIIWLIRIHAALPYSIMGAICLQAAVLGLFLPETKGTATLETMDDMKKRSEQGVEMFVNYGVKGDKNDNENPSGSTPSRKNGAKKKSGEKEQLRIEEEEEVAPAVGEEGEEQVTFTGEASPAPSEQEEETRSPEGNNTKRKRPTDPAEDNSNEEGKSEDEFQDVIASSQASCLASQPKPKRSANHSRISYGKRKDTGRVSAASPIEETEEEEHDKDEIEENTSPVESPKSKTPPRKRTKRDLPEDIFEESPTIETDSDLPSGL